MMLRGTGSYRFILAYPGWKRDSMAPVYTDDGILPYFLSRRDAEAAAIRHDLPLLKIEVVGFPRITWGIFSEAFDVAPYEPQMQFDAARVEAIDGKMQRFDMKTAIRI